MATIFFFLAFFVWTQINPLKNRPTFCNWDKWNKSDKLGNSAIIHFLSGVFSSVAVSWLFIHRTMAARNVLRRVSILLYQ